jgi:prepilin-type N-terminal cleavage/methylation domain-containing protein
MKKGFTLVELLAVIAILAILIIIALPNILSMFNKAKEDTFFTEAKSVMRAAQQEFIANEGKSLIYSNSTGAGCDEAVDMKMSGTSALKYLVIFDPDGKIVMLAVWDNDNGFSVDDEDGINIQDINNNNDELDRFDVDGNPDLDCNRNI